MTERTFSLELDAVKAHLLDSASRAPSAHNTQPWLLSFGESYVDISFSEARRIPAIDPTDIDLKHALGVVLENMLLTLSRLGLQGEYEIADEWLPQRTVVSLCWRNLDGEPNRDLIQLERAIPIRTTSRLPYRLQPIDECLRDQMQEMAQSRCELHVLSDQQQIDQVRKLTVQANAKQLACPPVAAELYAWLRYSPRDIRWFRDGLNADCMALKRWESRLATVLTHPKVLLAGKWFGLPKLLCSSVDQQAPPTPTLCLLTTNRSKLADRIEAGRILQRLWLTAATQQYFTHPLSAAIETPGLREQVLDAFDLSHDVAHVNLFRLGRSATPARSARLPVDELLTVPS
ncbi:MAG: hypothetical protein H8E66_13555 [Planctomycetes bacterium]|nr:hypothetical protein [Planctomycetota bacterium]